MEVEDEEEAAIITSTPSNGFALSIIKSVLQQEMNDEVILPCNALSVVIYNSSSHFGINNYTL